ncbi:acyl-CoA synthetase [Pelomyxa schiedti]|nr:acyl-CoA synthetase [Pelomyxa schiedti]
MGLKAEHNGLVRRVCGRCAEGYDTCEKCFAKGNTSSHRAAVERESKTLATLWEDLPNHSDGGKADAFKRHAMHLEPIFFERVADSLKKCSTSAESLKIAFELWEPRWFLGSRPRYSQASPKTNSTVTFEFLPQERDFQWMTYEQVKVRVYSLARALISKHRSADGKKSIIDFGITPLTVHTDTVAIIGASSECWYMSQYACLMAGLASIPVHPSWSSRTMAKVFARSSPRVVFSSIHLRETVLSACALQQEECTSPGNGHVELVVFFDDNDEAYSCLRNADSETKSSCTNTSPSMNSTVESIKPIIAKWEEIDCQDDSISIPASVASPDTVVMLLPTSGTTGNPKLIIMTDGLNAPSKKSNNKNSEMLLHQVHSPQHVTSDALIMLAFEPLRQTLDVISKGGRIGVWSGSMGTLVEDCTVLRPSVFGSTPNFWHGLHSQFLAELNDLATHNSGIDREELCATLEQEWSQRRVLGNRLRLVVTGGSSIRKEVKKWMSNVFTCPVIDGYGTTETGGVSANSVVHPGTNFQLLDCPELGYLTSDKPYPRGEIIVRTSRMTPGYWNDSEATNKQFVTLHGLRFFRTGDIGQLVEGKLQVIDRSSAVFKLLQGVFVAPEPLESLYATSSTVSQIFICGESQMPFVAAVVVPSVLCRNGAGDANSDIELVKQAIMNDIRRIACENKCKPWEIPQILIVESEPFSQWNGLLSSQNKLCRPALLRKYKATLLDIFSRSQSAELSCTPVPSLPTSSPATASTTAVPTVLCAGLIQCLADTLSSSLIVSNPSQIENCSLMDLGADSMALARLSSSIKSRFGINIPLPQLAKLSTLVELQNVIFCGPTNHQAETKHEFWCAEVESLWKEVETTIMSTRFGSSETTEPPLIVLTGVTGFVGAFLLHNLMRLPTYQIACVVRHGSSDSRLRVLKNLQHYGLVCSDSQFEKVLIYECDISDKGAGSLCVLLRDVSHRVCAIIHNAAEVNSTLSYAKLKQSNAVGTQQALLLSLQCGTSVPAPFFYISTVGVTAVDVHEKYWRDSVIPDEYNSVYGSVPPESVQVLSGYGQSKWVAEKLVLKTAIFASKQEDTWMSKWHCSIIRLGDVSGSTLTGASNPNDSVTHIISGICCDQCYPHNSSPPSSIPTPFPLPQVFSFAPVDWVATSITNAVQQVISSISTLKLHAESSASVTASSGHSHNPPRLILLDLRGSPSTTLSDIAEAVHSTTGNTIKQLTESQYKTHAESVMDENHPMFVLKSAICGPGFLSPSSPNGNSNGNNSSSSDSNSESYFCISQCPITNPQYLSRIVDWIKTNC